ncbi:MAG: hypothetical protein ACE10G_07740, partial [Gemmatimonadales bacterium]
MHKFWPMGALMALLAGTLTAPATAQESQGPKVVEIGARRGMGDSSTTGHCSSLTERRVAWRAVPFREVDP